jgi:hypothetical protein
LSRDPEGFQEIEKNCSSRGTIFQEFSLPMNDRDPVEKPARQTPNNTHCHRMKSTLRSTLFLPFALAAITSSLQAATLVFSTTAPTVDDADISNFTGTASDGANVANGNDAGTYLAHDRGSIGQAFTTGANAGGYTLSAFSFQSVTYGGTYGYTNDNAGMTLTLRVGTIATTTLTTLSTEFIALTGLEANQPANGFPATGNGNFVTFTLAAPLALAANTSYFFDVTHTGGASYFFETNGTNTDSLPNSQAYYTAGKLDTTAILDTGDRVFHADIAAVPEPSAALLGVLGVTGVLALGRRRRA